LQKNSGIIFALLSTLPSQPGDAGDSGKDCTGNNQPTVMGVGPQPLAEFTGSGIL
jgi:hypothetical protein